MFGMSLSTLITVVLIGAVSGWIASIIMGTKGGLLRNIIIGVIGGFLGSFIFGLLGFNVSSNPQNNNSFISLLELSSVPWTYTSTVLFKTNK